jgi:periplasmic mercuric ion binding protein
MKKLILTLLISTFLFSATTLVNKANAEATLSSQQIANQTQIFAIDKMTCKMCHITVRKAMEQVDGVVKATVDYDTKTATVVFDPKKADVETIALASTNAGYPATIKSPK